MKFYPMIDVSFDTNVLPNDYKAAREIGKARLGEECLYVREKMKTYYVPYSALTRVFRRVVSIRATMCCGKGNLEIEHVVVCTERGETAQIQMPGERAGKILLEELSKKAPQAAIGKPEATEGEAPESCPLEGETK